MKIAIAQINPVIADIKGNTLKIIDNIKKALSLKADLVIFPEMAITGYPPMDLLENKKLIDDNLYALDEIAKSVKGLTVICGYVDRNESVSPSLYNAAAVISTGEIKSRHFKTLLPTYDVFDEHRYFSSAADNIVADICGKKVGITICEDLWSDEGISSSYVDGRRYFTDPVEDLVKKNSQIIINISASPFVMGKLDVRLNRSVRIAKNFNIPVVYVNQVGGNDSLVFDGASFAVDSNGNTAVQAKRFEEDLIVFDSEKTYDDLKIQDDPMEDILNALILGVRDYLQKCGFKKAVIGLSGGIDSALTAAIAVMALGAENVTGITMPSIYSSKGSVDDSYHLAQNLGIEMKTIPIKGLFDQFNQDLTEVFEGKEPDVTEENIQARIRGNLLMAISNKFGALLLTTGNKSELSMGYCTLYGDMSGGLAVISDLPKTLVFDLSKYINREKEIIPWNTIKKPPSAELREDQKDEDSLPPYDILDGILERYIERKMSLSEIIDDGYDSEIVEFVLKAVDRNEYKRRQAAPGIKITGKAFGLGRRIPIAQKFRQ